MRAARKYATGALHVRWGDGSYIHSKGYVMVNVGKTHPLADSKGYVPLHVLVWVAAGNPRPTLKEGKLLHHVNEIKRDNRYENLKVLEWQLHTLLHNQQARELDDLPDESDPMLANDERPY